MNYSVNVCDNAPLELIAIKQQQEENVNFVLRNVLQTSHWTHIWQF